MKNKYIVAKISLIAVLALVTFSGCLVEGPGFLHDLTYRAIVVEGISVDTHGMKTVYVDGQTFDLSGIELIVTYSDGSTARIPCGDADVSIDPPQGTELSGVGERTVTVTYEGQTTTFTIAVEPFEATGITVEPPTKTFYVVGEEIDLTGLVATVTYSDGTPATIPWGDYRLSADPEGLLTESGTFPVTVTYGGVGTAATAFNITVVPFEARALLRTNGSSAYVLANSGIYLYTRESSSATGGMNLQSIELTVPEAERKTKKVTVRDDDNNEIVEFGEQASSGVFLGKTAGATQWSVYTLNTETYTTEITATYRTSVANDSSGSGQTSSLFLGTIVFLAYDGTSWNWGVAGYGNSGSYAVDLSDKGQVKSITGYKIDSVDSLLLITDTGIMYTVEADGSFSEIAVEDTETPDELVLMYRHWWSNGTDIYSRFYLLYNIGDSLYISTQRLNGTLTKMTSISSGSSISGQKAVASLRYNPSSGTRFQIVATENALYQVNNASSATTVGNVEINQEGRSFSSLGWGDNQELLGAMDSINNSGGAINSSAGVFATKAGDVIFYTNISAVF